MNLTTTGHAVTSLSIGGPLCILSHSLTFCAQRLTYQILLGEGDILKFILRKHNGSVCTEWRWLRVRENADWAMKKQKTERFSTNRLSSSKEELAHGII